MVNNQKKSVEASIVETKSDGDCFVASNTENGSKNEWILDSGCTFHMSHNRDWFTTYFHTIDTWMV